MICHVFKRRRRTADGIQESRQWFGALRMDWQRETRIWSLGTTDKREAWRNLYSERDNEEKRRNGLLPPQEAVDAASVELNDLLERFLGHLRKADCSEGTLKKYGNARVHFKSCGWRVLDDIEADSFYEWRSASPLSVKTKNDFLRNTQAFIRWLRRERMLPQDPLEFVDPLPSIPRSFRRSESDERIQRLLHVASPERAAVYLTAVRTGLRRKELQSLTLADFELDAPNPFVRVPASIAKNRKEATLWLRSEVVAAVRSVLPANVQPSHKVFAGLVPRLPRFKKDLDAAGIPFTDSKGRRFDFHSLRVAFGTSLAAAGVMPAVAQQLMRHSDPRLTMNIYTDPSQLPTAAAVASLPALSISSTVSGTAIGTVKSTETAVAACLEESQPDVRVIAS